MMANTAQIAWTARDSRHCRHCVDFVDSSGSRNSGANRDIRATRNNMVDSSDH